MSQLIRQFSDFSLWKISDEYIKEASKFIVETNYNHHEGSCPLEIEQEIKDVYKKEIQNKDNSYFYAVRNNNHEIIGTIRALRWNGMIQLPIQSIFGIDIYDIKQKNAAIKDIWHIGCFAINTQSIGRASVIVLKILLTQAIFHVCTTDSLMFAECDRKLFEKLKLLNICSCEAGKSQYYIGSETVPVYNTSSKLKQFLWKQKDYLYINGIESIFPTENRRELQTTESFSVEQVWAV